MDLHLQLGSLDLQLSNTCQSGGGTSVFTTIKTLQLMQRTLHKLLVVPLQCWFVAVHAVDGS